MIYFKFLFSWGEEGLGRRGQGGKAEGVGGLGTGMGREGWGDIERERERKDK